MKDEKIIELFWSRDEAAISETEKKYGELCYYVISNILAVKEDVEECVNDVLLALWNNIPPEKPLKLRSYIGKSARNLALNRSREANTWKRAANYRLVGEELLEMLDDGSDLAAEYEAKRAGEIINRFLDTLKKDDRVIFNMRFWLGMSYPDISEKTGFGISRIKMSISRTRKNLAQVLKKEGITV